MDSPVTLGDVIGLFLGEIGETRHAALGVGSQGR